MRTVVYSLIDVMYFIHGLVHWSFGFWRSFVALVVWDAACLFGEAWMAPLFVAALLLKAAMHRHVVRQVVSMVCF